MSRLYGSLNLPVISKFSFLDVKKESKVVKQDHGLKDKP